jgi:hypothetical protein
MLVRAMYRAGRLPHLFLVVKVDFLIRDMAGKTAMFSTQTKMLILFLSDENPLWNIALVHPPSVGKIAAYLGVGLGTIENWKSGKNVNEDTIDAAFSKIFERIETPPLSLKNRRSEKAKSSPNICQNIDQGKKAKAKAIAEGFYAAYKSLSARAGEVPAKPRVYDVAANTLNMTTGQGQKIIDEVIYDRFSMFPNICYESSDDAEASLRRFRGTYHLWARRDGRWLQSKMRVRYVVSIKSRSAIRCKLNIPVIRTEPYQIPYWEYDGFLRTYENKVFWMFEKRELEGVDFFYLITCKGDVYGRNDEARFTLSGKYLTTGQDAQKSIVADDVLLQRIPSQDTGVNHQISGTDEEMHTGIETVKDKNEDRVICRILEDLRTPRHG